ATLDSNTTNDAGGTATIAGILDGGLGNAGTATLSGTVTGAVTNTGDLNIAGGNIGTLLDNNIGGDVDVVGGGSVGTSVTNAAAFDVNSGTFTVGAGAGAFTNESGSTLGVAAGSSLDAVVTNETGGTVNLLGTINGSLTNNSLLNVSGGAAAVNGALTSTAGSTLNLQNGATNDVLTISGDADLSGTVQVDVDLTDIADVGTVPTANTADLVSVGGNLSGTVDLSFNNIGAEGNVVNLALFEVTGAGTNTLSFGNISGLPLFSEFEYFTELVGNDIFLQSRVSAGIANLASTVALSQTLVDTIINRPTSPFVSDLAADASTNPCGAGAWARVTGGTANADGSFVDETSGASGQSPVSLNYSGIQAGGDFACFDGFYNGWDLAFGGILGLNRGSSTNNVFAIDPSSGATTDILLSVTETDIEQTYGGVYLTAARGRFFADLQYRLEQTEFESTNFAVFDANSGFDLTNEEYESNSRTLSGSVGYSWPVSAIEGLTFISSVGFSFTDSETDPINLGADGTLAVDDSESQIGFVSGTLARSRILPDNVSVLSYFGTATLYNDFASDRTATFTPAGGGTPRQLTIGTIGSYAELSAGLNYVRLLTPGSDGKPRQLNAAVRLDARFGDDVESYALTGQIRFQF
ncbi:hypothetical protein RA29_19075, partial [Tateyamaria sp. ANG-S1]